MHIIGLLVADMNVCQFKTTMAPTAYFPPLWEAKHRFPNTDSYARTRGGSFSLRHAKFNDTSSFAQEQARIGLQCANTALVVQFPPTNYFAFDVVKFQLTATANSGCSEQGLKAKWVFNRCTFGNIDFDIER